MSSNFSGYSKAGLTFLSELGTRDKAWFDKNRKTYQSEVVDPTKAFVAATGERLAASFAPAIVAEPKTNGSISPINNDLRFSPDKSPYKDHLLLKFWEGDNKKSAPTLHIRVSATEVGFATGAMLPDLDRWRQLIDDDKTGEPFAEALTELARGRDLDIAGEGYKRVPKPYGSDHPRAAMLRMKWFQARWPTATPELVHSAEFADWSVEQLTACAHVHRWLVENLT